MRISKKCQYALKAVLELASHNSSQPMKIHDIADARSIPPRFLEIILNELRHAGFVESRRGNEGGYMLARPADKLTAGQIIECIQGPIALAADEKNAQNATENAAFEQLWQRVNNAVFQVCNDTTFADLVEIERTKRENAVPNYCI